MPFPFEEFLFAMRSIRPSLFILMFCLLFLYLSWRPLWHTDLWAHLAFGRQIVETKTLDRCEELLTFKPELPLSDTAWLSQVAGYAIYEFGGIAGLQMLYASCLTVSLMILWRMFSRNGISGWLCLAGIGLFGSVSWEQLKIIRPQLGGLLCYLLLFHRLTKETRTRSDWFFIPAIFALWVNLHGSFFIGLLMLGPFLFSDKLKKDKLHISELNGRARLLPSRLLLSILCLSAICLNPYGLLIFETVLEISANPNVKELLDWGPITFSMRQGRWVLAAVILFVIVKLWARQKSDFGLWLLILGFGYAMFLSSRMILWFAPVIVYVTLLQAQSLWDRYRPTTAPRERRPPFLIGWGIPTLLVFVTFFLSPLGWEIVTGKTQDPHRSLSSETPVDAVEYLLKLDGEGKIFNHFVWGDYILWKGNGKIKPFAFSHAHLIPKDVWQNFLHIRNGGDDSLKLLDRYDFDAAIFDPLVESKLYLLLESSDNWLLDYETEQAVIFFRIERAPPWLGLEHD